MKKFNIKSLAITAIGAWILLPAFSQTDAIATLFSQYEESENVTMISVSGNIFKLMAPSEGEGAGDEISQVAQQIQQVKIMINEASGNAKVQAKALAGKLPKDFEPMITVSDPDGNVNILIKSQGKTVSEVVLIADKSETLVVVDIVGNFNIDQLSDAINQTKNQAMGAIPEINEAIEWKITPNPAQPGQDVTLTIPEEMIGGEVFIYNLNGTRLSSMNLKNRQVIIPGNSLRSGAYLINLEKGGKRFGKKLIVE